MKRILSLILITAIVTTGCSRTDDESDTEQTTKETVTDFNDEPVTVAAETETTREPIYEETGQPVVEPAVLFEFPLAENATLLFEKVISENRRGYERVFSILYEDSDEPEHLADFNLGFEVLPDLSNANSCIAVSPDLTKIAVLTEPVSHRGGAWNILDVLEREIIMSNYEGIYQRHYTITAATWLDNENLLTIYAFRHGSSTVGGSVYYYNIIDNSHKVIIPKDYHFQIPRFENDGENLILTIAPDRGNAFYYEEDFFYKSIPLSQIHSLIENGETLTLDVEDIREIREIS